MTAEHPAAMMMVVVVAATVAVVLRDPLAGAEAEHVCQGQRCGSRILAGFRLGESVVDRGPRLGGREKLPPCCLA